MMATAVAGLDPDRHPAHRRPALRRRRCHRRRCEGLIPHDTHTYVQPAHFRHPRHPVLRARVVAEPLPGRRAAHAHGRRSTWCRTATACTPCSGASPRPRRPSSGSTDAATLTWRAGEATGQAVFEDVRTLRLRGVGMALRLVDAADGLTPFTGTYLFTDPVDGSAVFTSYETGRRYRVTSLAGDLEVHGPRGTRHRGAGGRARPTATRTGRRRSRRSTRRPTRLVPHGSFDDAVAAVTSTFGEYVDRIASWRTDADPGGRARRVRAVVRDGRARGSGDPRVGAHVDALDGQALELGPLLQRAGAGARGDRRGRRPVPRAVRPPGRHGRAARLDHPLRGALQLREAAHPRVGAARAAGPRRPAPHRGRAHRDPRTAGAAGPASGSSAGASRATRCPTTSTATTAAGTTRRRSTSTGSSSRRISRGSSRSSSRSWPTCPTSSSFPPTSGGARDDGCSTPCSATCGTARSSSRSVRCPGGRARRRACSTCCRWCSASGCPPTSAKGSPTRLEGHLTEFGPATEPVDSPHYEDDGYWRGPIWAPSTALVESGLRASGFTELADTVSARFRALCEISGFAENFDARTGAGLRDRAYTWTAAVYLTLAADAVARG